MAEAGQMATEVDFSKSERWRILKNVVVLSVAFMVQFTAFQGAANLQSSINTDEGMGTASLAAIYVSLVFSNLFLPVVMIKWLGCKWTVALSFITYMPYIGAQFWPRMYTLIPAGLMVGLGGGPLWCAKCTYLSVVSEVYSKITGVSADVLVVQFFGAFFMIFQFAQVWGNLISSLVLTSGDMSITVSNTTTSCGADFLANEVEVGDAVLVRPPAERVQLLAGLYLACMLAASVIVALGLDSLNRYNKERVGSGTGKSGLSLLGVTLRLLKERDQQLMLLMTTWLGLGQAFLGADYTAAYVSCSLGTGYVGFVMIAYGVANSASAIVTGYLVKLTGRVPAVCCAALLHVALLVTLLLWRPQPGPHQAPAFFAVAAVWGLCDGVWLVQINAFCGILFPGREEAAYSNFRMWESAGFIAAYAASPLLRASYKLIALLVTLLLALAGYMLAERRHATRHAEAPYEPTHKGVDNLNFDKVE